MTMPLYRTGRFLPAFFILVIGITIFSSCNLSYNNSNKGLKKLLQSIDSLAMAGKTDIANKKLRKLRPFIKNDDPLLSTYYSYLAEHHKNDSAIMVRYADSAINFFADEAVAKKYPDEYFKALLIKGDASIVSKEYSKALIYYNNAKNLLADGNCDDGDLAAKMASIYYNQENYNIAAKYWAESYALLENCHKPLLPQKLFFLKQAALDNAGYSFQQAGNIDSANYYYNLDLALINKTDSLNAIDSVYTRPARLVLYDNIGGLALKQDNPIKAEDYLSQSIAIQVQDTDGMRIPPYIKLIQLYLQNADYEKAINALRESRRLLDRFSKQNPKSEIKWNRLYAQYLYEQHQPDKAYIYQNTYIRLRDSLDNASFKLRRVDVERELTSIQQHNRLSEMEHQDKLEKIYIAGITIAVLLSVAISLFITRVLQESRKNQKETNLKNEHLQQTLGELEKANQNFIRIMRVMAHDLRNPLSGMIGLATVLHNEDLDADNKRILKRIESTGQKSLDMINDLLKSGFTDENEPIKKKPLDLNELLSESVDMLRFKASEKQQQIIFESDDVPLIARANHENLWRVFGNIIVNAIKFSHAGGTIRVSLHTRIDRLKKLAVISVIDSGIGIPESDKDKIFEMFTDAKRPGTDGEQPFGLGLSISKKIVQKHNGKLWFESTPDVGTTFFIELPL
jgi:signal transduction histidine kinase